MGEKRLLIFLLVFLFGFSNATPTFPVGEKTVKNDWFQCFETTSAGEMIVKECMTGAVGCFVDVLEQKDGRYEVSEARGCAFVDKPFSEDNQQFVCKTPRCNSLENYPANESFMPCYVLDNAGKPGIELCKTKSCFVRTLPSSYVENRGCWNDSNAEDDDVVVCDTPKCNPAEKYPVLDPKGYFCYKYHGPSGEDEALVKCPNQNCVVLIRNGLDLSWRYDRDCAYDQTFDDSHWICSTPGCNSQNNYPPGGVFSACYEGDVNGDITIKICTEHIKGLGCYVQVSEDKDGNYVYTGKRGCALVENEPFNKTNMQFWCRDSFCNSEKKLPVNKIIFSCYVSDGEEDVYLKPCQLDISSCKVEYKLDPTSNVTIFTQRRGCSNDRFDVHEEFYYCDSSRCNSLRTFAPNQAVFKCFGSEESSTEICSIRQCYVKTKNVDEYDVAFTNDRGCINKLNGTMENVLTCDTALCNSYDNYPIVDLEKDTNICFKTFGDYTALVKCPSNHCEIGFQKNEDGTLMSTQHRDCAFDDKPFDEEKTMTCSTSRCNSLKDLPVNKTFLACYENDADGNFTLRSCSSHAVGCYVEVSKAEDGNYTFTDNRGCAYVDEPFSDKNLRITCKSPRCNSVERYEPTENAFLCHHSDKDGGNLYLEPCENDVCFIENSFASNRSTFEYKRGCAHEKLEDPYYCKTSKCNSFEDLPRVDLYSDHCLKTFKDHSFWINCPKREDRRTCMYGRDDNYFGGYRVDCYEDGTELSTCYYMQCGRDFRLEFKTFRCIIGSKSSGYEEQDCKSESYHRFRKCLIIYNDDNSIKRRECGIEWEYFEKTFSCSEDLCNSVENYPDS